MWLDEHYKEYSPPYVLAAAISFIVLCPAVAGLRFLTRRITRTHIGIDDWLIVFSTVFVVGCAVCMIAGVALKAIGYPLPPPPATVSLSDAPSDSRRWNEQLEWAFFLLQILNMACTKLSAVFFMRRIFILPSNRWGYFGIATATVVVLLCCWCITFLLWFLFSCAPNFRGRWQTIQTYSHACRTDDDSDIWLAGTDFVTDLIVLGLPVAPILKLNMSKMRKAGVAGVFFIGSVALTASIVRLAELIHPVKMSVNEATNPNKDVSLLITDILYWSLLESGIAQIACCLPTFLALSRSRNRTSGLGPTTGRESKIPTKPKIMWPSVFKARSRLTDDSSGSLGVDYADPYHDNAGTSFTSSNTSSSRPLMRIQVTNTFEVNRFGHRTPPTYA